VLARQPAGIVAEYPLSAYYFALSRDSFHQEAHEHRLFAGFRQGSETQSRKVELQSLLAERTVPDLAGFGVRYVVVHHHGEPSAGLPRRGQRVRGLRLIAGDEAATLYRVVARPRSFTSYGLDGFHLPQGEPAGLRWVAANNAALELRGSCSPCVGTVTFRSGTFAQPRTLTIRSEDGRVLLRDRLTSGRQRVRVRVRFSRRTVVRLSTDPPPQPANSVPGNTDTRSVSIYVRQPVRFIADPRRGHRALSIAPP
jgi:hypothetical protein